MSTTERAGRGRAPAAPPAPGGEVADFPSTATSLPRVIGLDLSLTSTGIAGHGWCDRIKPAPLRGVERLHAIRDAVIGHCFSADLVVVEGPSYGSPGAGQHERAGLWWVIACAFDKLDIPMAVAAPAVLKKYATGRGNADKDAVLAAVIRRYTTVPITGNDEADAYVLCAMGLDRLGHAPEFVPAVQRAALDKVAWTGVGR